MNRLLFLITAGCLLCSTAIAQQREQGNLMIESMPEIRGTGSEVWCLLARDEGHGFRKKGNRDHQYNAIALFFQQHLLGN
jgi:hypothetical protein